MAAPMCPGTPQWHWVPQRLRNLNHLLKKNGVTREFFSFLILCKTFVFKLKHRHLYCFATLVITKANLFHEILNEAVVAILYSLLSPDVILDMPAAKIPKFQLSEDFNF